MTTTYHGAIDAKVQAQLEGTDFASSGVRKLAGGSVNYVYHAPLRKALIDGTADVLVKHGETHMARKPDFPLPMLRTVSPRFHYHNTMPKTSYRKLNINV
jgi:hypothetical protein